MSRFYMTGSNSRGNTVSAAGSSRGQDFHLRGWSVGVEVVARVADDGKDEFLVYATQGSNNPTGRRLIAVVALGEDGLPDAGFYEKSKFEAAV